MPHVYLGQFQKIDHAAVGPAWKAPATDCLGFVDFRSETQQDVTLPAQGYAFFLYDQLQADPLLTEYLGDALDAPLTLTKRIAVRAALNVPASSGTLRALLYELMIAFGDPTGQVRWRPIRIHPERGYELTLPGFGCIVSEPFSREHPAFQQTIDIRQESYRSRRGSAAPDEIDQLRRETAYLVESLFGRTLISDSDPALDQLIPPEYRSDGFLPHGSTFGDTFVEGSDTTLASHTPTGPDAGSGWTLQIAPDGDSISVIAATDTADYVRVGGGTVVYRMDDALASDDHSAEADVDVSSNQAGTQFGGAVIRMPNSATRTQYEGYIDFNGDTYSVIRWVSGSPTFLADELALGSAITPGTPVNVRLQHTSGDVIELYIDDVLEDSFASETAASGQVRGGVILRNSSVSHTYFLDNFVESDLAVPNTQGGEFPVYEPSVTRRLRVVSY